MSTPLYPQEIYLLERYSSAEYFDGMRRSWEAMLLHVEDCLARFMTRLPPDYRSRQVPFQPDIVWGQRVIPNFRQTASILDRDFIKLTHGDANGLFGASAVTADVRGQREFSSEWLDEVEPGAAARYEELLYLANGYASNIDTTASACWPKTLLSTNYSERLLGPLDPPAASPRYQLDPSVQVRTNEIIPESGVYLPEVDDAAAQFLIAGRSAPSARVGFNGQQYVAKSPSLWTRVRRVEGETVTDGLMDLLPATAMRQPNRIPGGEPCPKDGWWFTPSKAASRRYFRQGEVFPSVEGSEYGVTFWQWDVDQSDPEL